MNIEKWMKIFQMSINDMSIIIMSIIHGAEAWFYKQKLDALIFTNSDYKFILTNGTSIKVGDNISLVAQYFPNSWSSVEEYSENQVVIELKDTNGPLDSVIVFEFEISTGFITKIVFNTID